MFTSFLFSLQLLFRFYFEYCDSIVFQIVVLSCFHSRSHLIVFNVFDLVFLFFLFRISTWARLLLPCLEIRGGEGNVSTRWTPRQ